ncbi:NAD+ kinase [Anaerobacterium chartisolvens]|uniref:NAD kinase n=1 Tax=Anaerobacterium chartisolvens TaxID=1297424 RepID=A0A369B5K8_9FIRM|nr:NAD(+)/NADH kinase [Anaerobacterium chartisolvens]RCX16809.1 NAD+ kinase [Anaerobacterium chartisolvens]
MKTIGVITNRDKDHDLKYTRMLIDCILEKSELVRVASDAGKELGLEASENDDDVIFNQSDIIICLGGDGTFLKVARRAYLKGIPILGINLGSLGFLTEVEKCEIHNAADLIMDGKYDIEDRMMLEATIWDGDKMIARDFALNDIVISRGALSRILHLRTYINDDFVDSFPGDGLIVSSPTGSTAYSLSVGGPIVEPDIDLIIVSPICPHILYSRSFITAGSRVVKVVVEENYGHDAMVTVDGQMGYEIRGGFRIEVRKAEHSVKLAKITSRNFFNILRTKIYDRGESLRKNEVQQTR